MVSLSQAEIAKDDQYDHYHADDVKDVIQGSPPHAGALAEGSVLARRWFRLPGAHYRYDEPLWLRRPPLRDAALPALLIFAALVLLIPLRRRASYLSLLFTLPWLLPGMFTSCIERC